MIELCRGSKRRIVTWLVGSLLVLTSHPALADDSEERGIQAEKRFEEGLKLEASDPKAALDAFRSSYKLQAHYRVLYNIGRACQRLGDNDCATTSYRQYLKDGGKGISQKRRKEVERDLKALSSKPSPSGPPTKEEPPPPQPEANATADAQPEPSPAAQPDAKRGVPALPWIIAGTFGAATVVSGILTANASSDYEALQQKYPVHPTSLEAAHEKGHDLLLVTGALGAATVLSVGVASYFTWFRGGSSATRERTVGVAVGPSGVSITGRLP